MTSDVELLEAVLQQLRHSRPTPPRMAWVVSACNSGRRPYWIDRVTDLVEHPPATEAEWHHGLREIMTRELQERIRPHLGLSPDPSPENRSEVYRLMHAFDEELRAVLVSALYTKAKEAVLECGPSFKSR